MLPLARCYLKSSIWVDKPKHSVQSNLIIMTLVLAVVLQSLLGNKRIWRIQIVDPETEKASKWSLSQGCTTRFELLYCAWVSESSSVLQLLTCVVGNPGNIWKTNRKNTISCFVWIKKWKRSEVPQQVFSSVQLMNVKFRGDYIVKSNSCNQYPVDFSTG